VHALRATADDYCLLERDVIQVCWLVFTVLEEFTRRVSCAGKREYRCNGIRKRCDAASHPVRDGDP
jgi:hypothetical protein